jgi:GTP-binding protein
MEFADDTRCTIADIPGLIEGAHTGAGLGDRFLRHIERTSILVHLVGPPDDVDPALADVEHYLYAHKLVNEELSAYGDRMMSKPQIVCVTKTDLLPPEIVTEAVAALTAAGHETLAVSADTGEGIEALIAVMEKYIAELREVQNPAPVEYVTVVEEIAEEVEEVQAPPARCEPPRKNADEESPEEADDSLRW